MSTYLDTGVLIKLYCAEPDSMKAIRVVTRCAVPLILTGFQQLESANALRLKVFRKELRERQRQTAMQRMAEDVAAGVLVPTACDIDEILRISETLSSQWTHGVGCRTLDILHVATAKVLQVRDFVTSDQRQATLAEHAGLHVRGLS